MIDDNIFKCMLFIFNIFFISLIISFFSHCFLNATTFNYSSLSSIHISIILKTVFISSLVLESYFLLYFKGPTFTIPDYKKCSNLSLFLLTSTDKEFVDYFVVVSSSTLFAVSISDLLFPSLSKVQVTVFHFYFLFEKIINF